MDEGESLIASIQKHLQRKNQEIVRLESENVKLKESNNLLVKTNLKLLGKIDVLEEKICKK